ncbi:MAG: VOC family protein [Nocardioidaceae bacterium]
MDWQITIDCADPAPLVRFWAAALDYVVTPPPEGFDTWNAYYLSVGVPEDELDLDSDGADRIMDPTGAGPAFWFQVVPEPKTDKNRLHLDLFPTRRDRSLPLDERRRIVDATVADLEALGATIWRRLDDDPSHYAVTLRDPGGNEFCVA